jgi:predicted MFS family arabinose efflux permease
MPAPADALKLHFTGYQKFVVAVLAFLQFTIILDFMIISPLGAIVMPELGISTRQFGLAVSAYAFSAALSGILSAGFADRFDRKQLLLFFYGGFILGTLLCGVAPSYHWLLAGRIVTGLFGGVIGSVVLAISTDLFPLEMRGRVMGFVQTAFAASQVLGLPAGLFFANLWNWHAPFLAIIVLAVPAGLIIIFGMRPVTGHLGLAQERSPFAHFLHTLSDGRYTVAFAVTAILATGGFMLMPFGSAFLVNNVGIDLRHIPVIYLVTGLCTVFTGPLIGRAADRFGKYRTFCFGSAVSIVMVAIWTNMGRAPLALVILVSVLLFVGIFSRIIPSQALLSAIPEITKRGAFNAISASLQQLSGGIASLVAGAVIVQQADGHLLHFGWLGDIVICTTLASLALMYVIHKRVPESGVRR